MLDGAGPLRRADLQSRDGHRTHLVAIGGGCPKRVGRLNIKQNSYRTFESRTEAEEHVLNGGSVLIEGVAGVGKQFSRGA